LQLFCSNGKCGKDSSENPLQIGSLWRLLAKIAANSLSAAPKNIVSIRQVKSIDDFPVIDIAKDK
jgi:hypothetical protein